MVLAEVDDLVTALKVLTTRDQLPPIHAWDDPAAVGHGPQQVLEHTAAIAELLAPALRAVIADHLAFDAPAILEGDYLLPELVEIFDGAVRAVVFSENETAQLATNFRSREPWAGEQHARAQVSALWNTELQARAQTVGVPIVPSRPWATIGLRVRQALSMATAPRRIAVRPRHSLSSATRCRHGR